MLPTLRTRTQFLFVQRSSQAYRGRYIKIYFAANHESITRVGFTVSRKVGKAVVRNLIKRRLRALTGECAKNWVSDFDYVVIAFPQISRASFRELKEEYIWLLKKIRRHVLSV